MLLCYYYHLLTCYKFHRAAWKTGVWAWDCVHEDHVLVIPFVATLLGDNPMQSEFACYVGPGGKFLCRICDVKGKDSLEGPQPSSTTPASHDGMNGGCSTPDLIGTSDSNGNGNSSAGDTSAPSNGQRKKLKFMHEMVEHVTCFV